MAEVAPVNDPASFHFDHIVPSAKAGEELDRTRLNYKNLLEAVLSQIPAGRERALAVTHLETSLMFATKAIVVADSKNDQKEEPGE